jgi:hypothetical protein
MYADTKKKTTQDAHTKVFGDNNISQVVARAWRLELWGWSSFGHAKLAMGSSSTFFSSSCH